MQKDLSMLTWVHGCKHRCARHGGHCAHFPKLMPSELHVEIAGSTCVGFSAFGEQWAWLDPSSLVFCVWAWMLRHVRPHLVVRECVPGFPPEKLHMALNWGSCEQSPLYVVQSTTFNPTDLGMPVVRKRRYTLCFLRGAVEPRIHYDADRFLLSTGHRLAADAN
eukprot:9276329-Pyramimonas_sp.AAC.1